jgi:O-acetyl-ADP-ribose deacetylase (regulator of RNase III)
MTRIELWNGDICVLEVDAIVSPATPTLWMSTGIAGALKRAGGDSIEFAAVRQGPVPVGSAVVTPAGTLAASAIVHAVSLDRDRRTTGAAIDTAVRSAMERVREMRARSAAIPAMGTDVGGFPLEESAALTVRAVRDALAGMPDLEHIVFALRGLPAYEAFERALGLGAADTILPVPDEVGVPAKRPTTTGEAGA